MDKYDIQGMSCAACSASIEKAVSNIEGVNQCSVNLLTNSMIVEGSATPEQIINAVEDAGYGASIHGNEKIAKSKDVDELKDTETPRLLKRLISSIVFLLILMYFTMGHIMFSWPLPEKLATNPMGIALIELILTSIIVLINRKFFTSGFKAVIHKAPNMDTLVALGSSIAFIWSLYEMFSMSFAQANGATHQAHELLMNLYFESSAMILTLITIGKTLEAYSKGKTTNALKSLMTLRPDTATILRNGQEITIPIDDVKIGDIVVVRPGEAIPVDGVVVEGESAINESSLTGESLPIDKKVDDSVYSSTINLSSYLKCKATRVGDETTLSQIIKMVSDASSTKAPIAKLADKISGIFVPVVLSIALIVTIIWLFISKDVGYSLARGISVLVISCPCALGLATPVAIMVGSGKGAKMGVLFKNATAIETLGKVNVVVLDKTGTITKGEMQVNEVISYMDSESKLIQLAASIEKYSEHPLAKAIVSYALNKNISLLDVENFEILPGNGLKADINKDTIYAGNLNYIVSICKNINISNELDALASQGATPIILATKEKVLGIISIKDGIKEDSKKAIALIKSLGIKVYMLTGDNEITAKAIANEVGIDEVIANVKPQDKEGAIKSLQDNNSVAMVGDGINDAPALTSADVGIAIGAGSDIAIDSASVVLVNNDLTSLYNAIRLGKKTLINIKENLFWAFIYNVICIPIAAGAFIPLGLTLEPMYGALAMSFSSVSVVLNALRLNLFKKAEPKNDSKENIEIKPPKGEENMEKPIKLSIEGMMCMHCEAHVKDALQKMTGVKEVKVVDHEKNLAEIIVTKDIDEKAFFETIKEAGYEFKGII